MDGNLSQPWFHLMMREKTWTMGWIPQYSFAQALPVLLLITVPVTIALVYIDPMLPSLAFLVVKENSLFHV